MSAVTMRNPACQDWSSLYGASGSCLSQQGPQPLQAQRPRLTGTGHLRGDPGPLTRRAERAVHPGQLGVRAGLLLTLGTLQLGAAGLLVHVRQAAAVKGSGPLTGQLIHSVRVRDLAALREFCLQPLRRHRRRPRGAVLTALHTDTS